MGGSVFRTFAACIVLAAGGAACPAAAEAEPARADALAAEAATMNRSMQEIARLLRELLDGHQVELLIRRLDLKQRGMAPMEQELRGARSERDNLSSELTGLGARVEELDSRIGEESRGSADREQSPWRMMRSELEANVKRLRERLTMLDQRIIELENDLSSSRREILALEETVDARLGLR